MSTNFASSQNFGNQIQNLLPELGQTYSAICVITAFYMSKGTFRDMNLKEKMNIEQNCLLHVHLNTFEENLNKTIVFWTGSVTLLAVVVSCNFFMSILTFWWGFRERDEKQMSELWAMSLRSLEEILQFYVFIENFNEKKFLKNIFSLLERKQLHSSYQNRILRVDKNI